MIDRLRHFWRRSTDEEAPVRFSIVVPIYNSDVRYLRELLEAIRDQSHPDWECIIVDDGSTDDRGVELSRQFSVDDARFRVRRRPENGGIAAATNDAIELATHEWVVFCDHDDVLLPGALATIAAHIGEHPLDDLIYSDERVIDDDGAPVVDYRKPDYSPERLLGHNYFCHVVTVRHSLIERIGGLDARFEPVADNDFDFRAAAEARSVGHIPLVLYGWRSIPGSLASAGDAKDNVSEAVVASATEHLRRIGSTAHASPSQDAPTLVRIDRPMVTDAVRQITVDASTTAGEIDQALSDTTEPYLALTVLGAPEDWYAPLVSLCAQPRVALAGPRLVTSDDRLVSAGRIHHPYLTDLNQGIDGGNHGPWGAFCVNREVVSIAAPGAVFDCHAVREIGGLDLERLLHGIGGSSVPAHLRLDLAMALLGTILWQQNMPVIWSPLTTLVVDDSYLRSDEQWAELALAQRGVADHAPALLEDPYSPIGTHRS